MWLLREKLSDFGVKQILYRVDIALYVHPKNSLRSHLRTIMVLDHSRLRMETNSWKTNQAEFLAFDIKFSLQNLADKSGGVLTNLLYVLYITSEEKEFYEALFLSYRPRTKCSSSQFFKTNCIHSLFWTIKARVDF